MNPGHFAKIFDIVDSGFDWTFAAFGLIFVAVGVIGVFNPSLIPIKGQAFFDARPKLRKYFWLGILLFAVVSTVGALVSSYSTYARLRSIVAENRCRVVEGPVEQFVPRPSSGHGAESFSRSGCSVQIFRLHPQRRFQHDVREWRADRREFVRSDLLRGRQEHHPASRDCRRQTAWPAFNSEHPVIFRLPSGCCSSV